MKQQPDSDLYDKHHACWLSTNIPDLYSGDSWSQSWSEPF